MDASDARWLMSALDSAVEGLDRCLASPRRVTKSNIGTLHFMPMSRGRSIWGVVKRYPDQREPFYAVFEVEGDAEPSIIQEAHYIATRRLERYYLAASAPILAAMACAEGAMPSTVARPEEDFHAVSMRIPPNPFHGEPWKLRYRHRELSRQVFELEYAAADLTQAYVYSEPLLSFDS